MPAVSKKQQRFFGIVRAAQKGTLKGKKTLAVQRAASSMKKKDVKKFASTKHKGLPEKKMKKESVEFQHFQEKCWKGYEKKGMKTMFGKRYPNCVKKKRVSEGTSYGLYKGDGKVKFKLNKPKKKKEVKEDYVKELEDGLVKLDYPTYDEVDELMKKISKDNGIDTTVLHMAFKTKHLMVPDDWAKKQMLEPKPLKSVEECWKTHKKVGMKMKGGKLVNDCRPKNEEFVNEGVKAKRKPKKAMDAGSRLRRKKQREEHRRYVSDIIPDELMDSYDPKEEALKKSELTVKKNLQPKKFTGPGKPLDRKTIKRMNKPEGQFSSYEPDMDMVEEQEPDGMTLKAKKNLDRQKQLFKKQQEAPVVKNKIVRLQKEGSYQDFENKSGVRAVKPKKETELPKTPKKKPESTFASGNPVGKANVRKMINVSKGSKADLKSRGILGKIKYVLTGEEVIYEYDGNYHMNKIAKEKKLDLTDPRQRRKANSLARHNAAKGNVNNPMGRKKRKKKRKLLEGNLHQWFKGSKSKDGKGGWVNVVTGGTCASDKPGEGTPKCVSSSKRASMTKAERLSAQRRKKKADPNQQSKTGAAKPTYVKTDSPRKKKKVSEAVKFEKGMTDSQKIQRRNVHAFGKGYNKPTGNFEQDALLMTPTNAADMRYYEHEDRRGVKKKKGVKEEYIEEKKVRRDEYGDIVGGPPISKTQKAKNLAKNEKDEKITHSNSYEPDMSLVEGTPAWQRKAGKSESGGLNAKGVASYRAANPGSKLKTAVTTKPSKLKKGSKSSKRRLSFCRRMKGMKKKLTSAKTARDPDSRINKSLRKWNCSFEPETGEMIMERGPQTLGFGTRKSSIHNKKKKSTKKVSGMIKSLKRKGTILKQSMGPLDASRKASRLKNLKDDVDLTILRLIDEGHMNKTCGEGEYYCYQSKKCKKIPKGMKIGYGGMLKPDKDDSEETKGKNGNGNGNGNGHGGNGNGNGNGGGDGGGE